MRAVQASRQELAVHQQDISSLIKDVPDFMVSVERASWLAAFSELNRLLKEAEENVRDTSKVKALSDEFSKLSEQLIGHSLALRECAWAARGPSVHGGVNELLYLLDQLEVDPSEDNAARLQVKLDVEFTRLENQAQMLGELPEFMQLAMQELLPEYQQLLNMAGAFLEMEEEEAEEYMGQLEDWATAYGSYDLDFLMKRYSQMPTPIPSLNLALNSQLLYLDEVVVEEIVDHAVNTAIETLQSAGEEFLQRTGLTEVVRHQYQELMEQMTDLLEGLPEVEDRDMLREEGGKLVQLTGRFVSLQGESESESGSRLDYKTE